MFFEVFQIILKDRQAWEAVDCLAEVLSALTGVLISLHVSYFLLRGGYFKVELQASEFPAQWVS